MTCRDVDDQIEAIVSGEEASEAVRAHVEGCVRCAAALATARRIELAIVARPISRAPAEFTAAVVRRIRGDRWRAEQHVDRLFNSIIAAGVLVLLAAVLALFNLSGVTGTLRAGLVLANQMMSRMLVRAVPELSTYLLASALLFTALFVWWWAERTFSVKW
jgi:anti-sigma factor RsiW